jgi:hypothetical protein
VTVEEYRYPACFHAAIVQNSAMPRSVRRVRTGSELIDQLNNASARYIQLMNDVKVPAHAMASVDRIVEVRACHPQSGETYTLDLNNLEMGIMVGGNLIFNGDITIAGTGWPNQVNGPMNHLDCIVAGALPSTPVGVVEFEDVALLGDLPTTAGGGNRGQGAVQSALMLPPTVGLRGAPRNLTLAEPQREFSPLEGGRERGGALHTQRNSSYAPPKANISQPNDNQTKPKKTKASTSSSFTSTRPPPRRPPPPRGRARSRSSTRR